MEEGISLFSSLLNNKHFLIVFVHALEQQKDFAVRDRSGSGRGPGARWRPHGPSWLGLARPKAGPVCKSPCLPGSRHPPGAGPARASLSWAWTPQMGAHRHRGCCGR